MHPMPELSSLLKQLRLSGNGSSLNAFPPSGASKSPKSAALTSPAPLSMSRERTRSAMLGDAEASPIAIAALMSVWRGKTKAVPEALQDDNTAFAFLARHALLTQATVDAEFSARLWQSLFLLTEHERGRKMDEASVLEVVGMVALVAAHSDLINGSVSRESFKTAFVKGLAGEYAELIFIKSYKKWRCDLARNLKADDPPFSRLGNSMLGGTSYRQRWHGSYRSNLSPQPPES